MKLKEWSFLTLMLFYLFGCENAKSENNSHKATEFNSIPKESSKTITNRQTIDEFKINLLLPEGWEGGKSGEGLYAYSPQCLEEVFCDNVILKVVYKQDEKPLKDYANILLNTLQGRFDNYELNNFESIEINGLTFFVLSYSFTEQETPLEARTAIFERYSDVLLMVSVTAESQNDPNNLFSNILNSIQLVN